MPRPAKGARLYLRADNGRAASYIIKDTGDIRIPTGTANRGEAEKALAAYISRKHRPSRPLESTVLTCAEALTYYGEEHAANVAAPERIGYAIAALDRFWGDLPVSAIKAATCRRYAADRGVAAGTVRRELGVLQAAVNHCAREGYLLSAPQVTLPAPPEPKDRWLTRQEVSWMLRGARSLRMDGRHLQDFILTGIYTGTRKSALLALRIGTADIDGGHIDTVNGVLYRQPLGKIRTKKQQPSVRLPSRFLAFTRRWAANGRRFVVQDYQGNRVGDVHKGWANAVEIAVRLAARKGIEIDLSGVTPHVLRHTAITWAMQAGAREWDVCGYFGISLDMLQKVYGHHHPDHQQSAVEAMDSRGRR